MKGGDKRENNPKRGRSDKVGANNKREEIEYIRQIKNIINFEDKEYQQEENLLIREDILDTDKAH